MPKKKTPVRAPWTKVDIRQLKVHSKAKTPAVDVAKGDEAHRGGGPAKGQDDWHWPRSSQLETLAAIGSPKGGGSSLSILIQAVSDLRSRPSQGVRMQI
jgi:hypothetical protein